MKSFEIATKNMYEFKKKKRMFKLTNDEMIL